RRPLCGAATQLENVVILHGSEDLQLGLRDAPDAPGHRPRGKPGAMGRLIDVTLPVPVIEVLRRHSSLHFNRAAATGNFSAGSSRPHVTAPRPFFESCIHCANLSLSSMASNEAQEGIRCESGTVPQR